MELYVNRDDLSRGLARVQSIVERRSTQPMLAHVLLAATDGLRMTATDTEVAYIGHLEATVEARGDLAVDATQLFQVVRSLPDPTVHLALKGAFLMLTSGRAHFELPCQPASEFPALPAFDAHSEITLAEGDLRRMVEHTAFSVATDETRYGLNGAHLEAVDVDGQPRLRMVATDGHRLSSSETPIEGEAVVTPRMLVPRKALTVMRKLLSSRSEPVQLAFGQGAIRLTRGAQVFWFRMLDGEFPDYRAVVPAKPRETALIRRDEFTSTLKRVGILVSDRVRPVRFAFTEGQVEIQVSTRDRGNVQEVLAIDYEGPATEIGFNVRYLGDAVGILEGEHVRLQFDNALAPCLVTDPEHDAAFFVVMPMRLD